MLRAEKKRSKDVSLNEPIGTDKEGNTISLIDVVENDEMDTLEQIEKAENISLVQKYVAQILNEREKEILFDRDADFMVKHLSNDEGKWVIWLEEMKKNGK